MRPAAVLLVLSNYIAKSFVRCQDTCKYQEIKSKREVNEKFCVFLFCCSYSFFNFFYEFIVCKRMESE